MFRAGLLALAATSAVLASAIPVRLAAQGTERFVGPSSQALLQLFETYWAWRLSAEPELATSFGVSDYDDRWRDWSAEGRRRAREAREEFLQKALYLEPGNLSPEHLFQCYLLEYDLRAWLAAEPYLTALEPVSPLTGMHNAVFTVIDQMPALSRADYERRLARLAALPAYVDQHLALMREQLNGGLTQPAVVIDLVLAQVRAQAALAPDESPLLAAFRAFPDAVPLAERSELQQRARSLYESAFVPSWRRLAEFLDTTYRPGARRTDGIGGHPKGREAYSTLVRHFTTQRLTPDEWHARGLADVERIESEMTRLAREAGAASVPDYERQLRANPSMRFESRQAMLDAATDTLARVQPVLSRLFLRLPRTRVGVRPILPDQEAASASHYDAGTPDGSRPAWFSLRTYRPEDQLRYPLESLVLHETVPGHHLQVGLALEQEGVHHFQRGLSIAAFEEGWALYAESLGDDLGVVYRDRPARFGRLASERFRAVRLVVDTGLHAQGWSRDRAREYFAAHAPNQSLSEVDRYIAWPGQALAYKAGELRIRELRQRAEQRLGARFDLREFHDVVLRNGAIPLSMLEEAVDAWIAASRAN